MPSPPNAHRQPYNGASGKPYPTFVFEGFVITLYLSNTAEEKP